MSGADIAVLAGIIAGVAGLLALEHFAVNGKLARPLAYAAGTATLFAGVVVWLVYAAVGWRVVVGVAVVMSLPGAVTFGLHWRREKLEWAEQERLREQQLHTMKWEAFVQQLAAELGGTDPLAGKRFERVIALLENLRETIGFTNHNVTSMMTAQRRCVQDLKDLFKDMGVED